MSQVSRRQMLKTAAMAGVLGAVSGPKVLAGPRNTRYRWDLINVLGGCIEEGGDASSKARDGSRITVTGSGTFRDNPGDSQAVTGGGTWTIVGGASPGSGTYEVTGFVNFTLAPGALGLAAVDCIGDKEDARAGRVTLRIEYSDGSEGVLEVGCRLGGSPPSIMEGITATKGFVTFWNHEEPTAGVEGNRSLFHVQ